MYSDRLLSPLLLLTPGADMKGGTASPFWKDSLLVWLAAITLLLGAAGLLWLFETRFSKGRVPGQSISTKLSWGVLAVALLSLAILPAGVLSYQNLPASLPTRVALAISAWAVCWNLCFAALCAQPNPALMKTISSLSLGRVASRRLLPAALVIAFLLGWFWLQGQILGFYNDLYHIALFTLGDVLSFASLIWAGNAFLNRLDAQRFAAEEALRERERRLELVFEKSGVGDFVWSLADDQIYAHPTVWRLYGASETPARASSESFRSRYHPDDAAEIDRQIQIALDGKGPLDLEFRVMAGGGDVRWISCRGNVVRDEGGKPTHIRGLNIDITERKRAEERLMKITDAAREAELSLQMGLDFSKVTVWHWKVPEDVITWNGPVEEVFGRPASALPSLKEFERVLHPMEQERIAAALAASLEKGVVYRIDYRILVNNQVRWIAARAGVLRDEAGLISGMSGVCFDITSTKVAEERLQQSEQRFRELADAMPHIVWAANAEGQIDYFNRRWQEYTGSENYDVRSAIHPDDLKASGAAWRTARSTGAPMHCEVRIKRADQTFRWHLSSAIPIRDSDGKIVRWFGTSTDVDDYKRIQADIEPLNRKLEDRVEQRSAELAEVETRYRILVDGVKDYAIFMLDPQGHVTSWNEGSQHILGYEASEIIGQHFSKFFSRKDVLSGRPELALLQAVAEGRHIDESWRVRKNGEQFWTHVITTPILDTRGNVKGFSRIMRDMTQQRHALTSMAAERRKAELANEAKSNFLATMSHEIRTPMNAILGISDLLSETELDETQREYVKRFQRAGSNLMAIINDILDLSKIESGHFELEQVAFDLEDVAQRVADLVAPKAHQNKVNLACRVVPGLESWFIGDPNRLQQILLNLLSNAVKFTSDGEIVLTIRQHPDGVDNHVQFEVSDTGIGIPEDKLSAIFDDFTQAESSTTRRFGGTGLGLGIARRLVQRMGGVLSVTSEPGKGSTFTFDTFLRKAPQQPPFEYKQDALQDLSRQRILIVDSSTTNQMIYREMCVSSTMRADVTDSALKAIGLLKEASRTSEPFSIVLLDRFTSDLDAFEALRLIRVAFPTMPVILTTAEDQPGDATRSKAAGFSAYAVKPIRRATLLRHISWAFMEASSASAVHRTSGDVTSLAAAVNPKMALLIADDSEDNRFLIQAYLAGSAYEATFAADGQVALENFRRQRYDLVLMDLQMPVMDGLQAAAAIRSLEQHESRKPVPIIALTASVAADDISRSRQAGCNSHLAKPFSKTELFRVLAEWRTLPDSNSVRSTKY